MQVVKIQGGLGNQMFQYAFGQSLSGDVLYDLSWFEGDLISGKETSRALELEAFCCGLKVASAAEIRQAQGALIHRKSFLPSCLRKIFGGAKRDVYESVIFEDQACVFQSGFLEKRTNAYYEGYFNSERYFLPIEDKIRADFQLCVPFVGANQEMLEQISSTNAVSLHVRRGDYVNASKTYALCSLDYYQAAVEHILSNVENPHFFIFSDDLPWVVECLKLDCNFTLVDINDYKTGFNDLVLMSHCQHHIIANSTFSWWAAWLNPSPSKIVIAPKVWFATGKKSDQDLIPDSWLRL